MGDSPSPQYFTLTRTPPVVFEGQPGEYTTLSSVTISSTQPPATQVLGIRFYDSTDASGKFNTVEAANWNWQTPTDLGQTVLINLDQTSSPLVWQDSANTFRTTITAVPEPSTLALCAVGLGSIVVGAASSSPPRLTRQPTNLRPR